MSKKLLKDTLTPLYRYYKEKNEREFYRLFKKWGNYERYLKVDNVKFLDYSFDVPDLPSFLWQFKEIFSEEIYKFSPDTDTPVIFDCGANIGTSCLYFKTLFPHSKITAFEADPTIASTLKNNLDKNGIDNVVIISKAVWIDNEGVNFESEGADGGSINSDKATNIIPSIRLKQYLHEENSIDLLKIDIEGAEYDVLIDCQNSLEHVKNIFIEYHSWNGSRQKLSEILHILEKNNYRYYIEDIKKRKQPFINKGLNQNMDLQLNIFGYK